MLSTPPARFESDSQATDLVELLRGRATRTPHQRAFTFLVDGELERRHVTYGQLDAAARTIAVDLTRRGLRGERALLLYPSGLEFIEAFFGCLYAGVVAVPAYPPRRNRNLGRIEGIVRDATPGVALTTHEVFDRVEPMVGEVESLRALPWQCTGDLDRRAAESWVDPRVGPQTLAFLQYTSGSTGSPKGVMLSHGNLIHNTRMIGDAFLLSRAGEGFTWLPLYHDMGLIGGVIQPIFYGRMNTLMAPTHFLQKPVRWLRALSDSGAMVSGGPNFAYELCVERVSDEEKQGLDLSQWEVAFNGAEPVRAQTMRRFAEAFAPCGFRGSSFFPCYGLAEATLFVAGGDKWAGPVVGRFDTLALQQGRAEAPSPQATDSIEIVSSGGPFLGQRIAIADPETGAQQPDGRIGEVWVHGPSVAQGYWRREQATHETFAARLEEDPGPFLRTGDLGFVERGQLFITGRLKDLIIIRGANHYPQDIELTVEQSHPTLPASSGAAIAVGEQGAERLVVVQEMGRQRGLPFEEIFTAIRKRVVEAHDIAPDAIVLIKPNSIPKTSSGKIQRHACREAYERGELAVMADWSAQRGSTIHRKRGPERASRAADVTPDPLAGGADDTAASPAAPRGNDPGLVDRVMAVVHRVARERSRGVTLDASISEMGLDSLERMEIVAGLEDEFGGRFTEEAIMGMETCRDVVAAVEHCLLGHGPAAPGPRPIARGDYVFAESPEYVRLMGAFQMAEAAGFKNPYFTQHQGLTNDRTTIDGREYINWCSYNYLGLSGDPAVERAAIEAIQRYGTSVSASRLVSGEKPLHRELEQALADFIGAEDAIVLVGGHATNETVIGHLFGPGDLILHDALSHNSIVQGCRLSGALRRAFPHNDAAACEQLLKRYRAEHRRVLIVVEGVYSMDGDVAPLADFVRLKKEHQTYLMVDEAHSLGTMGATGHGMREHAGVHPRDVDVWMGTMSKSLGSCGGYIAGDAELIQYLKYTAPGFVYSVGLSPPNAAAALASLERLQAEPQRVERLRANSRLFLDLARRAGLNTGLSDGTPVIPVITGNSLHALRLSQALFEEGINVQPIMHPAVEESAARLRFFITSRHSEQQIRKTVEALGRAWRAIHRTACDAPTPREAVAVSEGGA